MATGESVFRGKESFILENRALRVTAFRQAGGKIVSLVHKETGRELLWQGESDIHPSCEYGSSYADGDLSGMDDMFPTINECPYPSPPWKGIMMPDHGELWSIPWTSTALADRVLFSTTGVRLPYRCEKELLLGDDGVLHMDYRIINMSAFDIDFIWALHPLFTIEEGSAILLPGSVKSIENTLNFKNRLGAAGSVHPWPKTVDAQGSPYDLSLIPGKHANTCEKFYAREELSEGKAGLTYPSIGKKLVLQFDTEELPYLGVWINAGGLKGHFNVALEPAAGALDDLYAAKAREKHGRLRAGGSFEFSMGISIQDL